MKSAPVPVDIRYRHCTLALGALQDQGTKITVHVQPDAEPLPPMQVAEAQFFTCNVARPYAVFAPGNILLTRATSEHVWCQVGTRLEMDSLIELTCRRCDA